MTKQYVLYDSAGFSYFLNPSFESWDFTKEKEKATVFSSYEEASKVKDAVRTATFMTYWDWSDIPPAPVIQEL